MRIPVFFFFCIITGVHQKAAAQHDIDLPRTQQLHKIKLSLLGLTYQWEKPVSRKSVLMLEGGVAGGMLLRAGAVSGTEFGYAIVPEVGIGFRNYYNLDKRFQKGKKIADNAANFIAGDIFLNGNSIVSSGNITANEAVGITAAWGMQRSLSSKMNFEWQAGVIAGTDFTEWVIAPNLRIALSFIAGKRNK